MRALRLLGCFIVLAFPALAFAWTHGSGFAAPNGGGMLLGANTGCYYCSNNKVLNWWKTAGAQEIVSSVSGTLAGKAAWDATGTGGGSYFNSTTGELANPSPSDLVSIDRLFFTPPASSAYPGLQGVGGTPWWSGQQFDISWQGTATGSIGASGLGSGGSSSFSAGSGTITLGTSGWGNVYLKLTITNVNDPPHNIQIVQHQYATNAAAGQIFNPDWLNLARSFGIIRFMSDQSTNNNAIGDFSQFADNTYTTILTDSSFVASTGDISIPTPGTNESFGPKGGIHPSLACAIANATGAAPYYNFPYGSNDALITQVATYFKNCLNPALEPLYEYANEIWNFAGGFESFRYANFQPYPPNQTVLTISSITVGPNPTVTLSSGSFSNGDLVCLNITSGTMKSSFFGNVTTVSSASGSTFVPSSNFDTTGQTFTSGTAYKCGVAQLWGGYRAAQVMELVRAAYGGSAGRSKWKGMLGSQQCCTGTTSNVLTGVNFWLANGSSVTHVSDLFDAGVTAPYWGNGIVDGIEVTSITKAATPTINYVCDTSGLNPCPTNGEVLRFYVASGMTQINNMTATITCSPCTSTGTLNINTSTFGTWVDTDGNFFIDNKLPAMIDTSISLNSSTPATYPTKYSYFTQEMSDSILNGTATNSGYVTDTSLNFTSGGIPLQFTQQAAAFSAVGLGYQQYEGGNTFAYTDQNGKNFIRTVTNLMDFIANWKYDAGTPGKNPAAIHAANFAAFTASGGHYPAQFLDANGGPSPFSGVRFYPGDSSNAYWTGVVTRNSQAP